MEDSKQKSRFRVVIVGGSIAGLTLAHCLIHHGIDFVVLEARDEIAPQEGASVSIFPTGSLVLDQLGILDDILELVEPLHDAYNWDSDGKLLCKVTVPVESQKIHAYPAAFLERRKLLQTIHLHLRERKDSILTGKKVTNVEHHDAHVLVHCADGSSFQGDMVVGADGVRSQVRQQMWCHMDTLGMVKEAQVERERMTCDYSCVFGIASSVPGVKTPDIHRTYGVDWAILVVAGKGDKVYFFFFKKLDRTYKSHEIPRYKHDDIPKHIAPYLDCPVTDIVKLSAIYDRAEIMAWTPIEEALYKHWCMDRFAYIGDAAHKMTPNAGFGANTAIESAVSLSNTIAAIQQSTQTKDIDQHLKEWEKHRKVRLTTAWNSAADIVRLETQAGFKHKIIKHFIPLLLFLGSSSRAASTAAAETLNCLPPPARSFHGTMPYKCHDDLTRVIKEKPWQRALWSLPLLGFTGLGLSTLGAIISQGQTELLAVIQQGTWALSPDKVINLRNPLLNLKPVDDFLKIVTTFFLPSIIGSDPQARAQVFTFLMDINGIFGIWLLESYRNAHSPLGVLLPISMGILGQLYGLAIMSPIYTALQYISISLEALAPSRNREIEPRNTYSLLLASMTAQCIPALASFFRPSLQDRRWWNAIWQLFPVLVPISQLVLKQVLKKRNVESAAPEIRKENRKRSIGAIRVAYGSFAVISAVGFLYARSTVESSAINLFWPGWESGFVGLSDGIRKFMQWDQIITMGAGFAWLGLRVRELKKSGVEFSTWKGVLGLLGTACMFGPGTAFALGWGMKEEMLHKLEC